MRILFDGAVAHSSRKTGIGYYAWNLLAALATRPEIEQLGIVHHGEVVAARDFLAPRPARERGLVTLPRMRQFLKPVLPLARTLSNWHRARVLDRASRSGSWTLFHETNYVSPPLSVRLVTTVCDLCYLRCSEHVPADRRRWLARGLQPCLERSSAIATISHFVRQELLEQFPRLDPARVFATPLGVDSNQFHNRVDRAALVDLRQRYQLPDEFLLFVGTREPRKNLQGLLAAFLTLPVELRRAFPMVLAGVAGWHEHAFRGWMERLLRDGSLRVLGYVPGEDVRHLLQAASVFCFPSLYEGFGLPPLEAAACGTPVLASRAGALPEVLGDAALYVDPHSVESIADGLTRMLDDASLRALLRARGLERAAQFTWSACATATLGTYRAASQLRIAG